MISVCGVICKTDCCSFGKSCKGCNKLNGKVSWVEFIGKSVCPIYQCAEDKKISSCGLCEKRPCDIWLIETRNPSVSEEVFMEDIRSRLSNLNKIYS